MLRGTKLPLLGFCVYKGDNKKPTQKDHPGRERAFARNSDF